MQNGIGAAKTVSPTSVTMFDFLKKLVSKKENKPASAPAAKTATPVRSAQLAGSSSAVSGVEVLSLSLRAILEKFTPDLRAQVNQMPDENIKVVLPVTTIMKQLTVGVVKMSLASLQRQAPPGVFRKTSIEEKQMVDVPLGEIFKTFDVSRLKLRPDQRNYEIPDMAGLFTGGQEPVILSTIQSAPGISQSNESSQTSDSKSSALAPLKMSAPAAPAPPPEPEEPEETLDFKLTDVAIGWPEADMTEIATLAPGTIVKVPLSAFTAGMPKGNVTVTWAQIIRGLDPQPTASLPIPTDRVYPLPLKVVAPKYFAIKALPAARESKVKVDTTAIPDFFGAGPDSTFAVPKPLKPVAPAPVAPAPIPAAPVRQIQPEVPPAPVAPVAPVPAVPEPEPVPPPAPVLPPEALVEPPPSAPLKFNVASEPEVAQAPEPTPEPEPVALAPVESEGHQHLKFTPSNEPVVIPEPEPEPVAPAPVESEGREQLRFTPSNEPVVIPEPEPEPVAPPPAEADAPERLRFNFTEEPVAAEEPIPAAEPEPVLEIAQDIQEYAPIVEPVPEPEVVSEPEIVNAPDLVEAEEVAPAPTLQFEPAPVEPLAIEEAEPVLEETVASPEPEPAYEAPVIEPAAVEPAATPEPAYPSDQSVIIPHAVASLADLFNTPDVSSWTASELIKQTCLLEGVEGALIALEEGLVVAHQLPESISSDSFAAFLPQIFKRIGRYVREMQLVETTELLIMTPKGPCQLFHRGKVFFAVLGRPGKTIPVGVGLVAEEIAKQNS